MHLKHHVNVLSLCIRVEYLYSTLSILVGCAAMGVMRSRLEPSFEMVKIPSTIGFDAERRAQLSVRLLGSFQR